MNDFVYINFDNGGVYMNLGILNKVVYNIICSIGK